MKRILIAFFVLSVFVLIMGAALGLNEQNSLVQLKGDKLNLTINPKTLEVINETSDGQKVVISDPVSKFTISNLKKEAEEISFRIEEEKTAVRFKLESDRLVATFEREDEGHFTWPVLKSTSGIDNYILPHNEGKFIPKADKQFLEYLAQNESRDCVEFLSMPFFAFQNEQNTYTYIMTSPFNNDMIFSENGGNIALSLSHAYTTNHEEKVFSYEIHVGDNDPIFPAKVFREYLFRTKQFVSLDEKAAQTPDVEKLYGGVQIYLWSAGVLDQSDIKNWLSFVKELYSGREKGKIQSLVWGHFSAELKQVITDCVEDGFVSQYARKVITRELNLMLKNKKICDTETVAPFKAFYDKAYGVSIVTNDEIDILLKKGIADLNKEEQYRLNLTIFFENFKAHMAYALEDLGNAFSTKMLDRLGDLGIDKAWLSGDNLAENWMYNKSVAEDAMNRGYLISTYDSYHSLHEPGAIYWETAEFDKDAWDTGAIMRKNGDYVEGFMQKGRKLSPLVSLPYVKERLMTITDNVKLNSWFVDCDAAGELYEDYNPLHTASMADDCAARKERIRYIIDTYDMVVGSELGNWYLTDTLHFAQGMMTPVIAWGDEDMQQNKESDYYLGSYWPPEGPDIYIKQVPLKTKYKYLYSDPRFRLPLYEAVYHDSIVISSHWGYSSLKFSNTRSEQSLTELLYSVQPLYNLNLEELEKHGEFISEFYSIFSPLHEKTATLEMTDFDFLTDDRRVQKTRFGDVVEIVVNYSDSDFLYNEISVAPMSALIRYLEEEKSVVYSAGNTKE